MFHHACPTCGETVEVTPDLAGQTVECGGCRGLFVAPAEGPAGRRRRRRREDYDEDEPRPSRENQLAVASLALGLVAVIGSVCCIVISVPAAVAGLVTGLLALRRPDGRGPAIAGLVLSGLGLFAALGMMALLFGAKLFAPPPAPAAPVPKVAPKKW